MSFRTDAPPHFCWGLNTGNMIYLRTIIMMTHHTSLQDSFQDLCRLLHGLSYNNKNRNPLQLRHFLVFKFKNILEIETPSLSRGATNRASLWICLAPKCNSRLQSGSCLRGDFGHKMRLMAEYLKECWPVITLHSCKEATPQKSTKYLLSIMPLWTAKWTVSLLSLTFSMEDTEAIERSI